MALHKATIVAKALEILNREGLDGVTKQGRSVNKRSRGTRKKDCMEPQRHKIHLTNEKATLLITLYAKALDNRSKCPLLHDTKADEMAALIDYDFEKLNGFDKGNLTVLRAKQLDEWLNAFLQNTPNAVVVNLGCGLDTRITRIHPPASVRWFDVDYPEVITLREQFYANREGYTMIGASVTSSEWIQQIPNTTPVMILAEGLLEYLSEEEVKTLFNRITDYFPSGQLAFDVMNSFAVRSGKSHLNKTMGAAHKWAVDNPDAVDKLDTRLKRIADLPLFASPYRHNLQWQFRLSYSVMAHIPPFRTMLRLLHYRF